MSGYHCCYCKHWKTADKTKQNGRICLITGKIIQENKEIKCNYFDPGLFYCEKNDCWLSVIICLNRRRNIPDFNGWQYCKKCRQFDKEMKDFVIEYWIEGKSIQIKKPEKKSIRKIKRRIKQTRKIKRRIKQTRKIKRRKNKSKG